MLPNLDPLGYFFIVCTPPRLHLEIVMIVDLTLWPHNPLVFWPIPQPMQHTGAIKRHNLSGDSPFIECVQDPPPLVCAHHQHLLCSPRAAQTCTVMVWWKYAFRSCLRAGRS